MRLPSTLCNCILKTSSDEVITPSLFFSFVLFFFFFSLSVLSLQCLRFSDEVVPTTAELVPFLDAILMF